MTRHPYRQRGTVYLLVLSVTAMLVAIGVTAVLVGRVDVKTERLEAEQAQARIIAQDGIELTRLRLENDGDWRTSHTDGAWSAAYPAGNGAYRYKLVDANDGNLADSATDPFRLYVEATVGDAVRIYSVTVRDGKVFSKDFNVVRSIDDAGESTVLGTSLTGADYMTLGDDGLYSGRGGVRFDNLPVQPGETIRAASIQFTSENARGDASTMTFWAHAHDDAPSFTGVLWEISGRTKSTAQADWSPEAWATNASGPEQLTPDLAELVQEIIDRPGWQAGNAVAFLIEATQARIARTYDHSPSTAPVLHLTYTAPGLTVDYTTLRRELAE